MAGIFRSRRKSGTRRSGSAPTAVPGGLDIVPDFDGVPAADGSVAWSGTTDSPVPAGGPAGPGGQASDGTAAHERSDPARAATDGLWEVIRPAAIVPEHAARRVLVELARRDLTNGGEWQSEPQLWRRFAGPTAAHTVTRELLGTIHVTYGTPTKYEITLYRVTVTAAGVADGWTVATLTDEALGFGGLTLAECPRATVITPPQPYTY